MYEKEDALKNNKLLKTNLLVSIILVIGFMLTAIFSYRANYRTSLNNIEQITTLTTEGIYYQLSARFTRPVSITLTMAHDRLLIDYLSEEQQHLKDDQYAKTIKNYLAAYHHKYQFDSVFLVSTGTSRYYNFNGVDRVLTRNNPENTWYYDLLTDNREYSLNVDNDEVKGADNKITIFVNCKIEDPNGKIIGAVGVGIRVNYLKELLKSYEEKYGIEAYLIDEKGDIQISTTVTGYQTRNWFELYNKKDRERQILDWKKDNENQEFWASSSSNNDNTSYIVSRYIPELSWHLLVEQNTGLLIKKMKTQLYQTFFIVVGVILIVLIVITAVIRNFNRQITKLIEERQAIFKKATEQLYDNIYELNITRNCSVGRHTEQYFESLGANDLPYEQGLRVIAEKQIKKEFREGYLSIFSPDNVVREFEKGNNHLRYDFMITQDGNDYHWMRIDAHIFYSVEDDSIHMFTYRKNIDAEKQKEVQANTDEMTRCYTKKATERVIEQQLSQKPDTAYAFFIFDIDNFKQANDQFGHAFGDMCIREFVGIIKKHFRETDIIGRIGGDEFAAFIPIPNIAWTETKAQELTAALDTVCTDKNASWKMSVSIGISLYPFHGKDFAALYLRADNALYQTKQHGKNGFTIYQD